MQTTIRNAVLTFSRSLVILGIAGATLVLAGTAEAQQNNQTRYLGSVSSSASTTGLSLFAFRTFSSIPIRSDVDNVYFYNPHPNASITVTVQVRSGINLDLVQLGAPAPSGYGYAWTKSQGALRTHQVQTTGPKGTYWIRIGENYLSGPGMSVYDVTVTVRPVLAQPIPLPPRFVANQCAPPVDLGTLSPGGGVQNLRLRSGIQIKPGDFDCYEFTANRPSTGGFNPFTLGLGTVVRFQLTNLPNTGTKFLFVLDTTAGQWRVLANTTGTSFDRYAHLPNGRYRVYVISGRDGFTQSNYSWTINTF